MSIPMTRRLAGLAIGLTMLSACASNSAGLPSLEGSNAKSFAAGSSAYETTVQYVVDFYPLWFTYSQTVHSPSNKLVGPVRMGPVYHDVVAPNDDTLYASVFMNVAQQPLIVTIPSTQATYSVLSTDAYGDVFDTGITTPGTYAFTGPQWSGNLPSSVKQITLPNNFSQFIVRADKYSAGGVDQTSQAEQFRKGLHAAPLSAYQSNPSSGATHIVPVAFYGIPYKTIADDTVTKNPMKFLKELQAAVASPNTPPLTSSQKALSDAFNAYFNASNPDTSALSAGAQKAHQLILNSYLDHTGKTNWITFATIGTTWTDLVRSAISEFIQYGNSHATAAYYQTFKDAKGNALDASSHGYVLTFTKSQIPQAQRFWSVTAYIPNSITLVANSAKKYLVGSYTPGLQKGRDGSISIYMAPKQPPHVAAANWLPVPSGSFNIMLRVYGPEGTVASNTYVPPAVRALP